MNQQKIGSFLKTLRKEKNYTQEQLAEITNVTNRSVSRWENGYNLPDLDILIQLADFYEIELRELLDGERKSEEMKNDMEQTVLKAVDYTHTNNEKHTKRINGLLLLSLILFLISQNIKLFGITDVALKQNITDFASGFAAMAIVVAVIMNSRYSKRIRAFKERITKLK